MTNFLIPLRTLKKTLMQLFGTKKHTVNINVLSVWPMSVLSMPLADTEQTAGLQSLTPDCLHDVGYAMFSLSPVLLWRHQIESTHD